MDKITIERETLQEAVYAMENATMYDDADFAALDALKGALLTSARAIAERFGNNTHWERFSARLGAAGIGSITPRTFRVLPSDSPPPAPDVLISKLANLRAMATERHVPEVDLATIDLVIEHLRYFSVIPATQKPDHD